MSANNSRTTLALLKQPSSVMRLVLCTQALATILALAPGIQMDRWVYFGLMSLLLQWVALLSLAILLAMQRWLQQMTLTVLSWIAVLVLLATTVLVSVLTVTLAPGVVPMDLEGLVMTWLRTAAMIVTAGILAALAFQNHWRSRQLALRAQQAEHDMLRARVNPHFLFNSLNTAVTLLHNKPHEAENVLLDLSDLFRAALSETREHTLLDEIRLTLQYLSIEQLRLGNRLKLVWDICPRAETARIPILALQTLVENAVRHGVERVTGDVTVTIKASASAEDVRVLVSNPLPSEAADTRGHRVGLAAARTRIQAMQPWPGTVNTREADGQFVAEIVLPRVRSE